MGIKVTEADATPFTLEELGSAIKTQPGRAPRPDKVPPEVIKENWKVAEVILILKSGKPPDISSSFRPICLLNTLGKLLEAMVRNRLQMELEGR